MGQPLSVISKEQKKAIFPEAPLCPPNMVLRTYTAERMPVLGELSVCVTYDNQTRQLPLVVVKGSGPALFGRNWLSSIRLNWKTIAYSCAQDVKCTLQDILQRFNGVFKEGLGTFTLGKTHLSVREGVTPVFHRPRPVPFAIRDAIEQEINSLVAAGILGKVSHSDWAAPIVPVPKKNGRFRICGDYKVTINAMLEVDQHPLPKPEELFATLAGGKQFTKLDLSQAYQQLLLDEESKQYLTVNIHLGLYRYTRLPFGISSAPAIFQRTMDSLLQGIPGVICYIDDILITGRDTADHLKSLAEVLSRLEKSGQRVKKKKCEFMAESVEFLGYHVDAAGLHTIPSKLEAIKEAPKPTNVQELRSFLGILNYYGKFIPNLATILTPLNALLQHKAVWSWSNDCQQAFQKAKDALTSSCVLTHYDVTLPLKLAADASAYGIGAVISHEYPDSQEKPIAFASRTLLSSERNYSQLEKEALALIYGVKNFTSICTAEYLPFLLITNPY